MSVASLAVATAVAAVVAGPVGAAPHSGTAVLPAPAERAGAPVVQARWSQPPGSSATPPGWPSTPPVWPSAPPSTTATTPGTSSKPPSSSPPARPGSVTGLRVAAVTPGSVTLAWNPVTPGCCPIKGYRVSYGRAFDDILRGRELGDVTTVTLTEGIFANGQFTFSVSAFDTSNQSGSGASVTTMTPYGTSGDVTAPSRPTGLRVTGQTADGVSLAWNASTDDVAVAGYDVYHFDGFFISTLVGTTTGTTAVAPLRYSQLRGSYYVRARDTSQNLSLASDPVPAPQGSNPPSNPPSSSPMPPPATCTFTWRYGSQWPGGFMAEAVYTNRSAVPIQDWTGMFIFGGDLMISSAWNAEVKQFGQQVDLTGYQWNRTIPAGGSVTIGILGTRTDNGRPPVTYASLKGAPCAVQ